MVFSSVVFVFYFLPIFLAAYALLTPLRALVIVLGSLIFYGWDDPRRVGLLVAFIVFNWLAGQAIAQRRSRFWLAFGCTVDVLVLIYFKYRGFLLDQANTSLSWLGIQPWHVAPLQLPLGISFFTFQGLSYLIDIARGVVQPPRSLLKFAMYKSMFPQLIAGPIVRYSQITAEIDTRRLELRRSALGVQLFILGLAQKVLIANMVAPAADAVFGLPAPQLSAADAWFGAICYTIQIYFDFSGYSNMAIGLGHILGFSLPKNFDNPYASRSMTEFWRRWHISLSTWFRDYLYIPLGGNRRGAARTTLNLLITFLLCGLWHGAAWTFAFWGLFHGVFLIVERVAPPIRLPALFRPLRHVYVLLVVIIGWVFFRAGSFSEAGQMLLAMAGLGHASPTAWPLQRFATNSVLTAATAASLVVVGTALWPARRWQLVGPAAQAGELAWTAVLLALFAASLIGIASGTYNPFVYFRF